jgi:site-specific recombinase XerC
VLRDASEVSHAARGSRHPYPEDDRGERVQRLLDSCDISDPAGVRDYAILMLVARLGLRSIEAARLQLDYLDWRAGRIVLRGNASREDEMPAARRCRGGVERLPVPRPASGEPPGASAAVLVGVAVGVEPSGIS